MSENVLIRPVNEKDSASLLQIYAPFIRETDITFEYDVPSVQEFADRISSVTKRYPWLVCESDGKVIGYAYASRHSERTAYQWSVNVSVYVKPEHHGKHLATALYTALFEILRRAGYFNAYACITTPNVKSEGFHQAFGFKPIGVFNNVGFKFGKWKSVRWFEYALSALSSDPQKPKPVYEVIAQEDLQKILEKAENILK